MCYRSVLNILFVAALLPAGLILIFSRPSYAVGFGISTYGSFGTGSIYKSSPDSWEDDGATDKVVKDGNARYLKSGIGLVVETSPFTRRFSFRMNPSVGFGRIYKSYDRKQYSHGNGELVSKRKEEENHDIIDYSINAKFCFKTLMRDDINIWVGPMITLGKSSDIHKYYNDYYFGIGVASGVNISLTDSVYFTAGPSICFLYSGNSNVDLFYADFRADIGVMLKR